MKNKSQTGFSYIEIIFTLAILALIATVAVPYVELTVKRKLENELQQNLRTLRTAIDEYYDAVQQGKIQVSADASGYPPNLNVLVNGIDDASTPDNRKIFFLRRIPRDPFHRDINVPAEQTWVLRSYDSPPNSPRAGRDIFDVFSTSKEIGLNGIPYNEW